MDPSLSPAGQQAARLDPADPPAVASAATAGAGAAAAAAAQPTTAPVPPCRARATSAPAAASTAAEPTEKSEKTEKADRPSRQALVRCTTPTAARRRSRSRGGPRAPSRTRAVVAREYAPPSAWPAAHAFRAVSLQGLPNEVLLLVLGFLDVNDLLSVSRTSRHLRCLCRAPIVHILRRRRVRAVLAPLVAPQRRPPLAELMARSIFLTHTTAVSRKLGRSLAAIRLARRLAARPPAQVLVERCVLPPECAPGIGHVAPALAARARAVERARVKDGLRRWVGAVWQREVGRRSESIRRREERVGIGKVWRLRRFWERISRGERDAV